MRTGIYDHVSGVDCGVLNQVHSYVVCLFVSKSWAQPNYGIFPVYHGYRLRVNGINSRSESDTKIYDTTNHVVVSVVNHDVDKILSTACCETSFRRLMGRLTYRNTVTAGNKHCSAGRPLSSSQYSGWKYFLTKWWYHAYNKIIYFILYSEIYPNAISK